MGKERNRIVFSYHKKFTQSKFIDDKYPFLYTSAMNKDDLIKVIKRILKTDTDLSFLNQLKKSELETVVACIRDAVDNNKE